MTKPVSPATPTIPPESAASPWTRRYFVKTATSVLAPMMAAGCATTGAAKPGPVTGPVAPTLPPDTRPLKLGWIGCGGRGSGAIVQALTADPNTTLHAMADAFGDRLDKSWNAVNASMGDAAAQRVQVPEERRFIGMDGYQKVIDSGVDVVVLTSYPHFYPKHLRAAVEAGKHVFVEKPVAVDGPGVRSVLESAALAEKKGLRVMVGFCWRYHDGMRAFFDQVNGGAMGDVLSVHTTYHAGTLPRHPRKPEWSDLEFQMRNWWHFHWLSGDHIVEQAVHSIDRLSWAIGDRQPLRVTCLGGRAARSGPEHGNGFDHFSAIYEYEGGLRAHHTCRQIDGCPKDNTDYLQGTKGSAICTGFSNKFDIIDRAGKPLWSYGGRTDRNMYQNEHNELFAAIRTGRALNALPRGARSTLTAIMARMAAYTGETVTWEQAMASLEDLTPPSYEFGPLPTPPVAIPGQTKFV